MIRIHNTDSIMNELLKKGKRNSNECRNNVRWTNETQKDFSKDDIHILINTLQNLMAALSEAAAAKLTKKWSTPKRCRISNKPRHVTNSTNCPPKTYLMRTSLKRSMPRPIWELKLWRSFLAKCWATCLLSTPNYATESSSWRSTMFALWDIL